MKVAKYLLVLIFLVLIIEASSFAQQNHDSGFTPKIILPAFPLSGGPTIFIDSGHYNFHTAEGRFRPFADLLRKDGYIVKRHKGVFSKTSLKKTNILVISNALHEDNATSWKLPTAPAFTNEEVNIVNQWVVNGGALLLIADHMPFPGASQALAASFGFNFNNGFAFNSKGESTIRFSRGDGSLANHSIIHGRGETESISSVLTFSGQAFQAPSKAIPLFIFSENSYSLSPKTPWQFTRDTPKINISGWNQGATLLYGKGRIAIFGEAAAFTAQISGASKRKVGMNSPNAPDNYQFVVNVVHWLSGLLIK